MHCLRTKFFWMVFVFYGTEAYKLIQPFYLFQNGLDLLTPEDLHFLSKNVLICIEG